MQGFILRKDYRENEVLRKSLSGLAASSFGISFEQWYQEEFWNERYIPFSYIEDEQVIANVSVSVLEEYANQVDFMYLFANDTVLDFYPRFGFIPAQEQLFSIDYTSGSTDSAGIRKLDGTQPDDLNFIRTFAAQRLPVSRRFGTEGTLGLLMFYCLNVFSDDLYYLENEDVIAICKQEGKELNIFDIVFTKAIDIQAVLAKLASSETEKIVFHFTPDYIGIEAESPPYPGGLFVRTCGNSSFPAHMKHPATSIA
ncbi:GNAT family N-acetyltransferase [Paenibacillus sp. FSL L8-0436]|uniref:GNAT family N-acetyltransferase n=1 Tax=Paenibacillus sp. FSL L8-0436 TaxID=2954686 RepID=UPI0031585A7A